MIADRTPAPARWTFPGEELLIDSTGFLELPNLPPQIVMVGGGLHRAGICPHCRPRRGEGNDCSPWANCPLEGFDPDLVKLLVKALEATGIRFMLEATVTEISGIAGDLTVHYRPARAKPDGSGPTRRSRGWPGGRHRRTEFG